MCFAQPSSESFLLQHGNTYRDPQPDIMQRLKNLGPLRPKSDVSIKSLSAQGTLGKRRQKECKSQSGWRIPKSQDFLDTRTGIYTNANTMGACTESVQLFTI